MTFGLEASAAEVSPFGLVGSNPTRELFFINNNHNNNHNNNKIKRLVWENKGKFIVTFGLGAQREKTCPVRACGFESHARIFLIFYFLKISSSKHLPRQFRYFNSEIYH